MHDAPARKHLPDHAEDVDERGVAIDRVGIRDLRWPVVVWDREQKTQATVATVEAAVALPARARGTHMSRFVEVLTGTRELSLRTLPDLLARVQRRLGAEGAHLRVAFPYFMTRHAPVSGVASLMEYGAAFVASREGDTFDFTLEVDVPVTTLCPCSKAISRAGAHNQRSWVKVAVRPRDFLWIEDVVEAVEACASAPLYALLKREDEKWVTEQAYANPRFVEDLVREVVLRLRDRASWLRVSASNHESIHNHAAFAEVTWPPNPVEAAVGAAPSPSASPRPFGVWLRERRAAHGLAQADLAARIGVSASLLSKVEHGERPLPEEAYGPLAEVLGEEETRVRIFAGQVPPALMASIRGDVEGFLAWARGR